MDAGDEKFFESLLNGEGGDDEKSRRDPERGRNIEDSGNNSAEGSETIAMGSYDPESFRVELARAETAAPRRMRPASTARTLKAPDTAEPEGQLTLDVFQTPDAIVVESAIAGVRAEDIDVNVTRDSVSIRGVRDHEAIVGRENYIYQECYWGRFARSIILPQEIDPDGAEVRLRNGILTLWLPKAIKRKTTKLNVRTD